MQFHKALHHHSSPRTVPLVCVGKVGLLLCLPPDFKCLELTLLCFLYPGVVSTHTCLLFCLQLHFKPVFQVQAGVLGCPSCFITLSKVLPTRWHQSIPAEGFVLCRDPENRVLCWSPIPSLTLVFRYSDNSDCPPCRSVGPAEARLFVYLKHWVLFASATKLSLFRGWGREEGRKEMGNGEQTL